MLNFVEYFVNRISTTKVPKIFDEFRNFQNLGNNHTLITLYFFATFTGFCSVCWCYPIEYSSEEANCGHRP